MELTAIDMARKLFRAEFVDVRPIAGVTANLVIYTAFTEPGDTVMALSIPDGGHISYAPKRIGGTAGRVRGLNVEYVPFDEEDLNIDVDKTKKKVEDLEEEGKKPRMIVFGGSVILFPHPVKELADFLKAHDVFILYDGAHVLGLIGGDEFQDPLREGADAITGSTHKTLPGPQGGVVLSWNRYADEIKRATFPGNVSNHHLHHVAGKAIVFAEMLAYGRAYSQQVVRNAEKLAEELYTRGLHVLGERHGFTRSHQVLVDVSGNGGGGLVEKKLEESNIIVNRNLLPYDIRFGRSYKNPGGIRLGVQELTRLGMGESEMVEVADLITAVILKGDRSTQVAERVAELRGKHQRVQYSFNDLPEAYEYIKIRS